MYVSEVASDARGLDSADVELIDVATDIVTRNGDGVVHSVGAAVRDSTGAIHGGLNVYHFSGGPCAELVALGAARAAGARQLSTIVAVGDEGRGVLAPCGRDCQVLVDYHPEIRVIIPTNEGLRSIPVQELLPFAYSRSGRHTPS